MTGQSILMYTTIVMIIILILLTIFTSIAANRANPTDYSSSRNYAITAAVVSSLAVVFNIGALIGMYYYGGKATSSMDLD